jgi:hypothetical protein
MNKKKVRKALKIIAERDGVTVKYVHSEIQKAIYLGMTNPDPQVKAYWLGIPHKGDKPTPEEVVSFMAEKVNKMK